MGYANRRLRPANGNSHSSVLKPVTRKKSHIVVWIGVPLLLLVVGAAAFGLVYMRDSKNCQATETSFVAGTEIKNCQAIETSFVAGTEIVNGIEWKYRVSHGKAEIYNGWYCAIPRHWTSRPMRWGLGDAPLKEHGEIIIPSMLGGCPVTRIGKHAFYECHSLTGVTIPKTVTSIGEGAFQSSGLMSVIIPNSVTSIEEDAFAHCHGLASVTMSDGVTSIGEGAFASCPTLRSVAIPNSVTNIGSCAFLDCSWLGSVTMANGVESIGENAFDGCGSLASVTIPDSVTSIGNEAFANCGRLKSVQLPQRFEGKLGRSVFVGCPDDMVITYYGRRAK